MKRLLFTALALPFILGSALAQTRGPGVALPGPGHPGPVRAGIPVACMEALALTDAQEASLATLQQSFESALPALVERRRAYRGQIDAALGAASPDPATIGALVIADHGVAVQMKDAHEQFLSRFQLLLNAEQRTTYAALRDNGVCAERMGPPR